MQPLREFVAQTLTSRRGLPEPRTSVAERIDELDDHMATTEALTWSITAGATAVGAASFLRLARAAPTTPAPTLVTRATICTWSLVAVALAKLWHAQEQHHTAQMKELLVLHDD